MKPGIVKRVVDMDKPKEEIVAKCEGCQGAIYHMDKNIVDVEVGDFVDSDGLVQGTKTIWKGHRKCFDERFTR